MIPCGMETKRETWRRFWPPCATVATFSGLLVDFRGAASKVGAMWPLIDALLPIIALAGATGGSIWLTGTVWEWWPPRKARQRKIAEFSTMAPNLYRLSRLTSNSHHYQEIRAIAFHLIELGISTPDPSEIGYEEGAWKSFLEELGNLAVHGLLTRARKENLHEDAPASGSAASKTSWLRRARRV